jgi:hypothetical protein
VDLPTDLETTGNGDRSASKRCRTQPSKAVEVADNVEPEILLDILGIRT